MVKLSKHNLTPYLKMEGYKVEEEVRFAPPRKFRADWMVSKDDKSCLIEYEGLMSAKSRHSTVTGYSNDCRKYNLAQLKGFTVLRYTALNLNDVAEDLKEFFK